ncbi:MAG: hypothetical protein QM779_00710 [Propionicimonas sp.]|uniref:hypothetical protein n=1 Tax=Propionicimonas sp. TaxID=1955623 RepID=UPI003D10970C
MPEFTVEPADRLVYGAFVDCNIAEAWVDGALRIFTGKYGEDPVWGEARDLRYADGADAIEAFTTPPDGFATPALPSNAAPGNPGLHGAVWFESIHSADPDGQRLYALYHNENYPVTLPWDEATGSGYHDADWPAGLQGEGSAQAVCRIGIMASVDGGASWMDRGILLEDRQSRLVLAPTNRNHTFPGGVGDPSAVACGDHLYVFFGEYGYPGEYRPDTWDAAAEASGQCISVARIALADLDRPTGRAHRWDGRSFAAPWDGVGAPIAALQVPPADGGGPVSAGDRAFHWGPSVSWNTHLDCWVMTFGRVESEFWAGDSVWISFNEHPDLGEGANSQRWTSPQLLLRKPGHTLWYPSLQPLADASDVEGRHTSVRLGRRARLWVKDLGPSVHRYLSEHVVVFGR